MNFLNYDSPFMTEFRKLVDYVWLGILWVVASIPLFTYGAATTAMLYTGEKAIRKEDGKVWRTFWKSFQREFKQATLLWLLSFVLKALLAVNGFLLWRAELRGIVLVLVLIALAFALCWMQLWFGYLSKFADTNRVLLGNTLRIALLRLPWGVGLLLLGALAVALTVISLFYAPPVILLIPGIYGLLAGTVLRKIFGKYIPEETETPEAETERSVTENM